MFGLVFGFVKSNFKWIGPLLLLAALAFFVNRAIDNMKEEAYNSGYAKKTEEVKKAIAEENKRNREFEQKLDIAITKYGERVVEESKRRIEKERIHTNNIETIVTERPIYTQCEVDQDVTDARNEIRKMGPESKK
jgi:bifunctional pyridoxal-dependent enzyme with beta-cystathionase and maltose regulon repressor activities